LRLLAFGFEAVQSLVEGAGEQLFVQNLTDGRENGALHDLVAHHDPIRADGIPALFMDRTPVEADGMTVGRGAMHPCDGGDSAAAGAARGEACQQVG